MTDAKLANYQSSCGMAQQLAKVHDCLYYIYAAEGDTFQVTPTVDEDKPMAAKVYPGGRVLAYALVAKRPGPK